jgi:hypothetical protein
MRALVLIAVLATVVTGQSNFRCPDVEGTYEDTVQCDKYYECIDGVARDFTCPDGLVFDPFSNKREPCDHYFNVDCGDRLELQTPKGPNDLCPRLNGFYAHPDPGVCTVFYACVEGAAEEYTCSPGLYFDEFRGVCNWPQETERTNCQSGALHALASGFTCPELTPKDAFGIADPHPKFSDSSDCAKFYICLNGVTPREQGCELGLVYNEQTQACDSPKNVPECKDYYAFLEDDDNQSVGGAAAASNRRRK